MVTACQSDLSKPEEMVTATAQTSAPTPSDSTEIGGHQSHDSLDASEVTEVIALPSASGESQEKTETVDTQEDIEVKKEEKKRSSKRKRRPVITFQKNVHHYGRITQGDKIEHKFVFTNTGKKELIISNATATCGCTQPSFPFMPIAPGEEGYIGVIFDSKGKLGRQKPAITITTNAKPATYQLYLEGYVDSPEKDNKDKTASEEQ